MDDDHEVEEHTDRPGIDLSAALGEAGHEVEKLGLDGVEDTGAIVHDGESEVDWEEEAERDIATEFPAD